MMSNLHVLSVDIDEKLILWWNIKYHTFKCRSQTVCLNSTEFSGGSDRSYASWTLKKFGKITTSGLFLLFIINLSYWIDIYVCARVVYVITDWYLNAECHHPLGVVKTG